MLDTKEEFLSLYNIFFSLYRRYENDRKISVSKLIDFFI